MTSELWHFFDNRLIEVEVNLGTQLAVADSFLVDAGRVRSLALHLSRFADWVHQISAVDAVLLDDFFSASLDLIPRSGSWFPRLELHTDKPEGSRLHLRLREAPPMLGDAVLWTYPEVDPRSNALVKGPDLSLGLQLRRRANMVGADEAVLLAPGGFIAEGALSAIVWWRGDTLCAPSRDTPWLDSITRREVFSIAEQMGLATRVEKAKPADLVESEVWMLSSLQAIRPVTSWIDLGGPLASPTHVELFNKRLKLLTATLD